MEFAYVNLGDTLPHPATGHLPTDHAKHASVVRQGVAAEAAGFDTLLLGEHHFNAFTISAPFVTLAAIAAQTSRIRLGTGVTLLPTRDPVYVAEEVATLDVVSGGRAEVGVGRGVHQGIFTAMDRPAEQASAILAEGVELLVRLLHEPAVTWEGRWRPPLHQTTIRPRPLQRRVPVWAGSTSNLELCARLGLPCTWVATIFPFDRLVPMADAARTAWVEAGRDLEAFELGIGVHCHVAPTSQGARDRFRPHFAHYFECSAAIEKSAIPRAVRPVARDVSLFDTVPFVGSPQEVVDRIALARDQLGLTRIGLVVDLGGLEEAVVHDQIELLATEVLPALRG